MKILAQSGNVDHSIVYIVEYDNKYLLECVESIQPPIPRSEKWVILVSTLFGCPVKCSMCDAGGYYQGKPTAEQIFEQIDFLVDQRFPGRIISSNQFKIQFARMGEPTFNPAVLDVLELLPQRYSAPGLIPSVSTIAPADSQEFLNKLLTIKNKYYSNGKFQLQFSIHTTDSVLRDRLVPVKKLSFSEIAEFGRRFYKKDDRKITLNFAVAKNQPVDPDVLIKYFSPEKFLIKLTPLNPTYRACENNMVSGMDIDSSNSKNSLANQLRSAGYEVIVSIGNTEENLIGSNCGQYLHSHLQATEKMADGYVYPILKASNNSA